MPGVRALQALRTKHAGLVLVERDCVGESVQCAENLGACQRPNDVVGEVELPQGLLLRILPTGLSSHRENLAFGISQLSPSVGAVRTARAL